MPTEAMSIGAAAFTEAIVEDAAFGWLESFGYSVLRGLDIVAGKPAISAKTEERALCPAALTEFHVVNMRHRDAR